MRPALILDIVALMIFALLARVAHPPFTLGGLVQAFWPWAVGAVIGWVIITAVSPRSRWSEGAIVWVSAIAGGMIIWAAVNQELPHYSFLIVAATSSAVLMFGWRAIAAVRGRKGTDTTPEGEAETVGGAGSASVPGAK